MKTTNWHTWFALLPVRLNTGKIAWLKTVERHGTIIHGIADGCSEDIWDFQYREVKRD